MKTSRWLVLIAALMVPAVAAVAAPIESAESGRAITARQQVEAFLSEQLVAQQLTTLGLSPQQVRDRLARLSDTQLEQLAGQIDLIQAGGNIEGGNPHPFGPLRCIFEPMGRFFYDLYHLVFCWGDLR